MMSINGETMYKAMTLNLVEQEIGITAVALALHLGLGTEEEETEHFVEAAHICVMIAKAREADRDNITLHLTGKQVFVVLVALNYGYDFYEAFKHPSEMDSVLEIFKKIGDNDSIEIFKERKNVCN